MAQNKVQYQHGLPILEFFETYGSHEQCEALVRNWRWPQGFVCPRCAQTWHSEFRRASRLYFQCGACRYQCSLVSGTIFESSKVPLPKWLAAMHLITQAKNNVSALELERHLGVSYPTGWLMKHKIMEIMRLREDGRQLTGRVEIDDAYLGGALAGGSPGRGSENKVSFVAAVQTTNDGKPVLVCFAKVPFTKNAPVQGRQHYPGQPEDRIGSHVSRLRLRQVRASLPRAGPIPVQSQIQPTHDPHPPGSRRLRHTSVPAPRHSGG